jgi:hypothetical protein
VRVFNDFPKLFSHTYAHCDRSKETFETHAWMVKTLLRRSSDSPSDKATFLLYIIAASYRKMNTRITKVTAYYDCLQKLSSQTPSFTYSHKEPLKHSAADEIFFDRMKTLPASVQIDYPLLLQANARQYNETTYIEFHKLLCDLLLRYKTSLEELIAVKHKSQTLPLEDIRSALTKVRVMGGHLRVMVRSSATEAHLKTISHLLDVDEKKNWTPLDSDTDFLDFQSFKAYSTRKGKILLPWESYRDWLMLMVHYFDAASVLAKHNSALQPGATISIAIMSPPIPDGKMLTWVDLLENERFFPALETESSGKDFIKFLSDIIATDYRSAEPDHVVQFYNNLKGSLKTGQHFSGKPHAEAYIAAMLAFGAQFVGHVVPFGEGPQADTLTPATRHIKELLDKIKVGHSFSYRSNLC